MSVFKKILVGLLASVSVFFVSCTEGEFVKVASVNAKVDGVAVDCMAAAKISNANDSIPVISSIFEDGGTLIYATQLVGTEKIYITYGGKSAGTYKTGANVESATDSILNYLIGYNNNNNNASLSDTLKNAISASSNITYVDSQGTKWYSTTCTVTITSQVEGSVATLINGSFTAKVYDGKGASKNISGTISYVPGF